MRMYVLGEFEFILISYLLTWSFVVRTLNSKSSPNGSGSRCTLLGLFSLLLVFSHMGDFALGTALGTQVVGVNAAHADFLAAVFKKSKLSKNQQNRDEGL
uniref:Uncharacterized protein n=1 Tax=Mus musculus TaxID=10090 RepID=Q8CEK4_MOUSE|nr:unnamed protein product [Mus musculus]